MFWVKTIKMTDFRCFRSKTIRFESGINVLIGDNAAGKTSIAEAVSYIANGKSFKNAKDSDVIQKDCEYFSIVATCGSSREEKRVVYCDSKGKKISKDETIYKKISDYYKETGVVTFSPDDLEIVKGSPALRRRLIDSCICQTDSAYYESLVLYNKLLKQRNEFLKSYVDNDQNNIFLDIIDGKLVEIGVNIINRRAEFIEKLSISAKNILNLISDSKEDLSLVYNPKVIANNYTKEMSNRRKRDMFMQTTTCGPHRDDVEITINGEKVSAIGSQGQIRSVVIAIKLGFYNILKEDKDDIIVILDDVLSELDALRQNQMMKLINTGSQMFITCTSLDSISDEIVKLSNIINVRKEE